MPVDAGFNLQKRVGCSV